MDEFHKRLRKVLDDNKVSDIQLSKILHVNKGTISKYLNGKSIPSIIFIQKVANWKPDLNLRWLITGKGKVWDAEPMLLEEPKPEYMNYKLLAEERLERINEQKQLIEMLSKTNEKKAD